MILRTTAGLAVQVRMLGLLLAVVVFSPASASIAAAQDFTATARYLAGMPIEPASPLSRYAKETSFRSHARSLKQSWQRLDERQLQKIKAWSKQHIDGHQSQMLYMFSGPDFLYADAFFPNADTYVLSGLEPVGRIPNIERLSASGRAALLAQMRNSLFTVLNYSFFITKRMKTDLTRGNAKGTIPLLYVFLARSGKSISDVQLITLKPDGTTVPREPKQKGYSDGVRIAFSGPDGKPRRLYYFTTDLSNWGMKKSGFQLFSEKLGPADSLVKSASYLMHSKNFKTAREHLLTQSVVLVQDDSGIPLRFLPEKDWKRQAFGRYLGPISIFPGRYQNRMRRLFARPETQRINWGIGYRWRTHETNVLLATKRRTATDLKPAEKKPTEKKAKLIKLAPADAKPAVKVEAVDAKAQATAAQAAPDKATMPEFKTPEAKTPEAKTPEAKTPEAKTPNPKTPEPNKPGEATIQMMPKPMIDQKAETLKPAPAVKAAPAPTSQQPAKPAQPAKNNATALKAANAAARAAEAASRAAQAASRAAEAAGKAADAASRAAQAASRAGSTTQSGPLRAGAGTPAP